MRAIRDRGTQTESLYEYDGDGNRTAEFFRSISGAYVFAQSYVEYDAANRVTAIKDDAYQVRYEYDAVGNRRRMTADYTDLVGYHKKTQDYWYEYDALNRFTVTMGVLSDGRIVAGAKGGDGVQLGYNAAGERVLAVYASDGRTERYEYDANGYLTNQSINGVVVRERENDLLGRVTGYTEYTADRSKRTEQVTRQYDADGLQTSERDLLEGATTRYTRMSDGTLERTERRPDKGDGTSVTTAYAYEWWDGAKQKTAVSQGTNPNAPGWKPASSYYNYDVNGNLKSVYDDGGGQQGKARAFSYWTDLRGQVQRRDELVGVSIAPDGTITGAQGDRKHNYYYLNGHRVGNVGNDGVEKVDYVQELAGKLGKGKESQYRVTTPVSVADFDENYLRIDGTYPGASPGMWTVREGETLKSIASALWGDETLWYVLADANGLKSTDELKAGQTLTVPNKVTNVHNTASTFKPYDPGQAIGDTQPTLPDPPPPPGRGGGCGGFLPVIAIVVAVVATVMTAGVAASVMAPTATAGMSTFAAGTGALTGTLGAGTAAVGAGAAAIGGAVGAVASQGVMIAGGAQSGLDWKGIALGAVGGAVSAGAGSALGLANTTASAVMQGAARSVVTQGVGVVTGLQHSFDWKGVAASAIASGVGFEAGRVIGSSVSGMNPEVGRFITRVGAGMAAGAASTVVRGGSLGRNVGAITMDAIASTVGNMVVDQVQAASVAKNSAPGFNPYDNVFGPSKLVADPFVADFAEPQRGMQFAGPGALGPVRELGVLPTIEVRPDKAWIDGGSGAAETSVAYGSGYAGALSAWSTAGQIDTSNVDPNAAAFRSTMNTTPGTSWDALTQQANARIAAGTYDRFTDLGRAIVDDGSIGQRVERFAHALTYTRPDAAEQIVAMRSPANPSAAALDAMLSSPFAGVAGGLMYAAGRSDRDAYYAAALVGSVEGVAAGAVGYRVPTAPQLGGMASARRVGAPNGAFVDAETTALQRIAKNNRVSSPWAELRQAYQQARTQVDFKHIEADVDFKVNGGYTAKGGHFSTSPAVNIVPGTETIGGNGTINAQVKLLGSDGKYYLKTNNGGFSSLTPDFWSLAQAKGEMSQAFLGRSQLPNGQWFGSSSGVDFRFFPPTNNAPLWRGYPIFTP